MGTVGEGRRERGTERGPERDAAARMDGKWTSGSGGSPSVAAAAVACEKAEKYVTPRAYSSGTCCGNLCHVNR